MNRSELHLKLDIYGYLNDFIGERIDAVLLNMVNAEMKFFDETFLVEQNIDLIKWDQLAVDNQMIIFVKFKNFNIKVQIKHQYGELFLIINHQVNNPDQQKNLALCVDAALRISRNFFIKDFYTK
jgi:hypothetical protein